MITALLYLNNVAKVEIYSFGTSLTPELHYV
eukprot:COSAG01_NODE_295_length_19292_cov_726.304538_15_plen_31_part_00